MNAFFIQNCCQVTTIILAWKILDQKIKICARGRVYNIIYTHIFCFPAFKQAFSQLRRKQIKSKNESVYYNQSINFIENSIKFEYHQINTEISRS